MLAFPTVCSRPTAVEAVAEVKGVRSIVVKTVPKVEWGLDSRFYQVQNFDKSWMLRGVDDLQHEFDALARNERLLGRISEQLDLGNVVVGGKLNLELD